MNLAALALKSYSFSYERLLTKKISFVAGFTTMKETRLSDLPLIKYVSDKVLEEGDPIKDDFNKIRVANTAHTGEIRFYMGSNPGARGFYFALYGRHATTEIKYAYEFETTSKVYELPIKSNIKGFGGGILLQSAYHLTFILLAIMVNRRVMLTHLPT